MSGCRLTTIKLIAPFIWRFRFADGHMASLEVGEQPGPHPLRPGPDCPRKRLPGVARAERQAGAKAAGPPPAAHIVPLVGELFQPP